MYLGVRAVLAKGIERIHKANLINFCVVPVELANLSDYDKINEGDKLRIDGLVEAIKDKDEVRVTEESGRYEFVGKLELSVRDREILLGGGLLKYTLERANDKSGKRVRDRHSKAGG
jgi:aconitate hydratase